MDSVLTANVIAYSAQVTCVVIAGSLLPGVLRVDVPRVRYFYWRALLALCLALPVLGERRILPAEEQAGIPVPWPGATAVQPSLDANGAHASIDWLLLAAIVVGVGILGRLSWVAFSLLHLRRLRSVGEMAPPNHDVDALQRALGVRAEIRFVADLRQPVTFGMRWPVVLLPTRLLDQPPDVQRAVLCHELVHVERRDWAWVLVEEVVRAVFWFHPAIWWVVSRVQLAREEVVDLEAVRMTGGRRTYIQALMAFADSVPLAPVAAFSRRRHLFRRILLISKEKVASPRRLMLSCAAMAAVLVAGSALAVAAFPLSERAVTSNGAGAGRSAAAAAGASRSSAPEPGAPSAAESVARPARADTPRTGLEGVDELTRRLQLRTAPTISPAPVQPVATIAVEETQSARSAAADDSSGPAPVASAGSAAPEDAGAAMRQDPPSVAASPPAAVSPPVRIGGRIAPPQKIKDVKPVYPPIAASAKVSGVVIVEATIGSDGRVNEVRVLRSIPLLDQAAMEAVRQWEFQPTLLNGAPISIVMSMTVNFALQN